ncbi:ATP-binding protein [Candidatus Woesearchaeota archaeon]|nr:ATP-binding protein [Candidatus Woesearchaeota archaeon]
MRYIERELEPELDKWLESREILAVRGPRQSGKTTLLRRIEEKLKAIGISEGNIHYVSFEDDLERLKFEEDAKEFVSFHTASGGKHYFLLDEVQYVKDIGKKLKAVFDLFSNTKLVISGSSSFDLTNMGSYLVGRIVFFNLYPFSFSEFLKVKGEKYESLYGKLHIDIKKKNLKVVKTVFLDDLNKFLHEYLTYGSYPRIILEDSHEKKKELLKSLFTTYVEKDIVSLYGIKYREGVVKLLKAVSSMLGNVVNYETLSLNSGLKYNEVREVLPLLEDSFVLFVVRPFYKNLLNELRKNPKIYFVDYGMRNYLQENFESMAFDALYENFVHNQLKRYCEVKYWRTTSKTEVDFVAEHKGALVPIEVKTKPKLGRSLRSFIQTYEPKTALMPNLTDAAKRNVGGCNVFAVPLAYL